MKVSIWGSCVTRDAFEIRPHLFDSIDYHARTSWVAQAAPAPGASLDTTPLDPEAPAFRLRMVQEDVERLVVHSLIEAKSDLIVFDLIDDRLDLIDAGEGAWVTDSDYLGGTRAKEQLAEAARNPFRSPERIEYFRAAVDALLPRLAEIPSTTPIVLHAAYCTPFVNDPDVTFNAGMANFAMTANDALAAFGREIQQALGPRLLTFESQPAVHRADPTHRWGLSTYHYERDYYVDLLDALEAAATGRAHSALVADASPTQPPPWVIVEATRVAEAQRVADAERQAEAARVADAKRVADAERRAEARRRAAQAQLTPARRARKWLARHAPESVKSAYRKVR